VTLDRVNYLNIGLMLIALIAAFILPFEVFLFSYAVLGPLHYLTEISWLHDRNYFSPRKLDWVPIAVLGLLFLLGARSIMGESISKFLDRIGLEDVTRFLGSFGYDIIFIAFGLALIFVVFKEWIYRTLAICLLLTCAYLIHVPDPVVPNAKLEQLSAACKAGDPVKCQEFTALAQKKVVKPYVSKWENPAYKIFGIYIPTLIHVYIFTGAFIIFGALKSRSKTGYLSFFIFIVCALSCFLLLPNSPGILAGKWAQTNYSNTFGQMSFHLLQDFGGSKFSNLLADTQFGGTETKSSLTAMVFSNPISIMFARFIAFAYTYHYLNWFSKTSVIKWHQVPKARFAVVIAAWVASVTLYFYSYEVGFKWLFLLSFLHVMLEFPLNHQSFIGIGRELRDIATGKKKAAVRVSR
jgi:hypothetical protein